MSDDLMCRYGCCGPQPLIDEIRRDRYTIEDALDDNTYSNEHVGSVAEAEGYSIDDYVEGFEMLRDALENLEQCALTLAEMAA